MRRVGDLVGQVDAGVEVADAQRVVLVAVGVATTMPPAVVGRHVEGADVEELVALGLDVLVEQHLVGRCRAVSATVVDRDSSDPSTVRVTYHQSPDRHGRRHVGLLHPRADLLEDRLDRSAAWLGEPRVGVGVLGVR